METLDRILTIVLDNQSDLKDLKNRVGQIEDVQDKTYNKLDGFLGLMQGHEHELAALRSAVERLEQRIGILEKSR